MISVSCIQRYTNEEKTTVNEKTALEIALSFSWSGKRSIVEVEEEGFPRLFDPLLSSAYIGVKGGCVVYVKDQGLYGKMLAYFSKCPVLSCFKNISRFLELSFNISERFQIPVILFSTEVPSLSVRSSPFDFEKNPERWAATPRFRFFLHRELNRKLREIKDYYGKLEDLLQWEGDGDIFLSDRPHHGYKTLLVPFLHPVPEDIIKKYVKSAVTDSFPLYWQLMGELDLRFEEGKEQFQIAQSKFLRGLSGNMDKIVVDEDISMDGDAISVPKGSSIGIALGMGKAGKRILAVTTIDSFLHSGIPALLNAYYNYTPIGIFVLGDKKNMVKKLCSSLGIDVYTLHSLDNVEIGDKLTVFIYE